MSNSSAISIPLLPLVKAPIGKRLVADFVALFIKNSTSDFESITGLVFALTATAVNPLLEATSSPLLIVSLSS